MAVATVASLVKANVDAKRRGHTLMEEVPHFTEEERPAERDAAGTER
jgi:tellurite resistance protein TerC